MTPRLDDSFARALPGLCEPWQAAAFPDPQLLVLNEAVAVDLGFDARSLRGTEGARLLTGQALLPGSRPVAQAYAGHQFGGYSPRLGDGRALLLGEIVTADGRRLDLHLKGSGRTRFARGGDGKAAVGPMLREYVISEAMHALGIPTTRSLAVVTTGERIARDNVLPGAVLARVASSHLRVGSFQYAANTDDSQLLADLTRHAIERHHPDAAHRDNPALALFDAVAEAQASLLARWMTVGFIHGVMNTDNMTISGETIDYGPCAFMDRYDVGTVFSSIDHGGRYAYGQQPRIAQWNLARLAEALLPSMADSQEAAVEMATASLHAFTDRYETHWSTLMRAKLGFRDDGTDPVGAGAGADAGPSVRALINDLLTLMQAHSIDHTSFLRSLSDVVRGDAEPTRAMWADAAAFDTWAVRWTAARAGDDRLDHQIADAMDRVNPVYIPRNHLVEDALDAATDGDLAPFTRLVDVVRRPYEVREGLGQYAQPALAAAAPYRTFCGT